MLFKRTYMKKAISRRKKCTAHAQYGNVHAAVGR